MSTASAAHVSHFTGFGGTPSSVGTLMMGGVVPGATPAMPPSAASVAGLPSDHMARLTQEAYVVGLASLGFAFGGAVAGHPGEIAGGLGAAAFAYRRAKRP
jgi:hypothetical protein